MAVENAQRGGVTGRSEMLPISFRHIERVAGSNLLGDLIMRIMPVSYVLLRRSIGLS